MGEPIELSMRLSKGVRTARGFYFEFYSADEQGIHREDYLRVNGDEEAYEKVGYDRTYRVTIEEDA